MAKEIKYGAEARKALESGVNQLADTDVIYLTICGSGTSSCCFTLSCAGSCCGGSSSVIGAATACQNSRCHYCGKYYR